MRKQILLAAALLLAFGTLHAQQKATVESFLGQHNYISTGMPILLIAPDGVASAMGDAGAASTPDAYSTHWNNAKFAFVDNDLGISTTYTPWLRNLGVSDMNFLYLGAYKRINSRSTAAASLTYFSLGELQHTGEDGEDQGTFMPNEFAFDVSYAMKLSEYFSLGASGRFMRSDLTNGMDVEQQSTKAAKGLSADVGIYYQQEVDKGQEVAAGLSITNLGSKLRYSDDNTQAEFLPANLRIGGRYSYEIDNYNKITALLDFNKLLVPTPPYIDEDGEVYGRYESIVDYRQTGAMQGAIYSFFDAPGGFKEELAEVSISAGAEYWYANTFAVRAGHFYEAKTKGGRQYATVGLGLKYNAFIFDFAYLIPTTNFNTNPLANTMRISLSVNFGKNKR